ncbi:hypothetical protein [Streptomyces europaeiscabiei]|uniref:hypothetical protein n=1 Tax=Streptomyces europaeiscabiei TaxID=146819 RepID=UPI002E0F4B72|nr:hypothetical protein OHB30_26915 [Streptomyces europaeiscabiei]
MPAYANESDNSEIVFCLDIDRRDELVSAAVSLGLIGPKSSQVSIRKDATLFSGSSAIEKWKKQHSADFNKSCSALIKATAISEGNAPKKETNLDFLNWLLPVIAGAALTFLAAEFQAARARRIANADAIRTCSAAFRDALIEYATEWTNNTTGGEPAATLIDKQRMQLITALRKAEIRKNWPFLTQLIDYLDGPHYRHGIKEGWHGTLTDRQRRAGDIQSHMTRLEADTEQVATMTSSAIPLFLMRGKKKSPTSTSNP